MNIMNIMNIIDIMPAPIAKTTVRNVLVSTIDCYSGFSGTRVAETMIFLEGGEMPAGLADQDGERCGLSGGKEQHAKWVAKVQEAQAQAAHNDMQAVVREQQAKESASEDRHERMVDMLLAYKDTPRHKLFEYPHRDDDSRRMIREAEETVSAVLAVANEQQS